MSRLFSRRRMLVAGGAAAVAAPIAARPAAAAEPPSGFVTLITPIRVFDSREAGSVLGGAKLQSGDNVAVGVSAALDGGFALAVFANITITQTEGIGYLTVWGEDLSGELPPPQTSNINWTSTGVTLANLALTSVGGENSIEIRCGGAGRAHVIVDIQGYVPFVV
jgi:hypothetical protein